MLLPNILRDIVGAQRNTVNLNVGYITCVITAFPCGKEEKDTVTQQITGVGDLRIE